MFNPYLIGIATDASQAISTLTVFSLGILVSIAQFKLFRVPRFFAFSLYIWQTIACLVFMGYLKANIADSRYYYAGIVNNNPDVMWGTNAIIRIASFLKDTLLLSYEGAFLFFNIISFIGTLALFSAMCSVLKPSSQKISWIAVLIILLPGLSVWPSAIGKDAITFFSAGIACWAIIAPRKRLIFLAIAILFMFVARPHIGVIFIIAISGSALLFGTLTRLQKLQVASLLVLFTLLMVKPTVDYVGFQGSLSFSAVANFIDSRQVANTGGELSYNLKEASIFVAFFNYLYGPLSFDIPPDLSTRGIFLMIITIENLIILLLSCILLFLKLEGRKSSLTNTALCFCTIYFITSLIVFSLTTANIGIAMRQKWMFLPMLFLVFCSYCRQDRRMKGR